MERNLWNGWMEYFSLASELLAFDLSSPKKVHKFSQTIKISQTYLESKYQQQSLLMDPFINQLQLPASANDDQQSQPLKKAATFFTYYHHQLDHQHQLPNANFMQDSCNFGDSFNFSSPKLKAKRRKSDLIQVHSSRIVQSTSRKDRHSKVCTSRGPKDRRLRLSPGTAIQFYDVQDRLGYDRPSKAIDWLMKEAKSAIELLESTENHTSENSRVQKMQQLDKLINLENPIPDLGSLANEKVPSSSTENRAWPDGDFDSSRKGREANEEDLLSYPSYQDGFMSPFDTNLQRIFVNSECSVTNSTTLPLHFTGPNQIFTQREPLQSSFINYSQIGDEFQGINFYGDELLTFTDAVKDKIQEISSRPCFQHQ